MIEWLRTSIPGIIILGAAGSILALLLLKVCRLIIYRKLAPFAKKTYFITLLAFQAPRYVIEYLRSSTDVRELIVTSALFLSLLILFAVMALLAAIGMAVSVVIISSNPQRVEGLVLLFFTSLFFFLFLMLFLKVNEWSFHLYMIHMKTADKEAIKKAEAEISTSFRSKN